MTFNNYIVIIINYIVIIINLILIFINVIVVIYLFVYHHILLLAILLI